MASFIVYILLKSHYSNGHETFALELKGFVLQGWSGGLGGGRGASSAESLCTRSI